jgi:hypothetical protein
MKLKAALVISEARELTQPLQTEKRTTYTNTEAPEKQD